MIHLDLEHLGAVWIAATLRPANISIVDYYQGLCLDQLQ
jgi:hypothetical protein